MRPAISKILVTGGAGFIGSAFVRLLLGRGSSRQSRDCPPQSYSEVFKRGLSLIVVDKLTYAGDLARLKGVCGKYTLYKCDICDEKSITRVFKKERPRAVINFAAETHVDRSITDASHFIETNIKGVRVLLDASMHYGVKKFIQLSTDEVYGETKKEGFREDSSLNPSSPYSASKAAADLLIKSYVRTYNFPAVIARPTNNYGPWQYPEKLIPVAINNALRDKKVPVYASGLNVREWLYVSDCAEAILFLLKEAKTGQIYNIGSGYRQKNLGVVRRILNILEKPSNLIEFVKDRPGHDWRYALDSSKIKNLGWRPKVSFLTGIAMTVGWYEENIHWLMKNSSVSGFRNTGKIPAG